MGATAVQDPPRIADGEELLRQLYDLHAAALLAYLTRLLRDRHHAEDVVQETLLRAWRHADTLALEQDRVRRWLLRVAHNLAVDRIRAQRARPAETSAEPGERIGLADHSERVVAAVSVARALRQLSPAHREVLTQVYLQDRTLAEAASQLQLPVGTVKSRVHFALRSLRLHLDEQAAA
jgi:RNA polymerase sigma-70 factor (ECF subfamily)